MFEQLERVSGGKTIHGSRRESEYRERKGMHVLRDGPGFRRGQLLRTWGVTAADVQFHSEDKAPFGPITMLYAMWHASAELEGYGQQGEFLDDSALCFHKVYRAEFRRPLVLPRGAGSDTCPCQRDTIRLHLHRPYVLLRLPTFCTRSADCIRPDLRWLTLIFCHLFQMSESINYHRPHLGCPAGFS